LNESPNLVNFPLLVFVNKTDVSQTQLSDVEQALSLQQYFSRIKFVSCCAYTGDGLYEGLDYLCSELGLGGENVTLY